MFAALNQLATQPAGPNFDNTALSTQQSALASGTAFTWSATATAGAYGIVHVYSNNNNVPPLTGTTVTVTWGGVSMTSLGAQANNNTQSQGWGWAFGLNGVPGGAQTISVTSTNTSSVAFSGWGSSYSYNNVTSVGTLQTAYGSSASPSVTVPAANTTDIVWGAIGGAIATSSAFSLTTRQLITTGRRLLVGDTIAGSTSVPVSATIGSNVWSAFGIDLR